MLLSTFYIILDMHVWCMVSPCCIHPPIVGEFWNGECVAGLAPGTNPKISHQRPRPMGHVPARGSAWG